jgi:hypothetical protein
MILSQGWISCPGNVNREGSPGFCDRSFRCVTYGRPFPPTLDLFSLVNYDGIRGHTDFFSRCNYPTGRYMTACSMLQTDILRSPKTAGLVLLATRVSGIGQQSGTNLTLATISHIISATRLVRVAIPKPTFRYNATNSPQPLFNRDRPNQH